MKTLMLTTGEKKYGKQGKIQEIKLNTYIAFLLNKSINLSKKIFMKFKFHELKY